MSQIKLIALDMDGTLLNSQQEVSDYTKDVIKKAIAKGVFVVLSTGRSLSSCYPYAEELKLDSFLVTSNGGQIFDKDQHLIEEFLLSPDKMEEMYYIAEKYEASTWIVSTNHIFFDERPADFYAHEWLKFGCEIKKQGEIEKIVKDLSYIDGLELTNSLPTNVEVNPKGVNKAKALETVCEQLGITMENVLSCGDSLNDIKMIQKSAIGVAMGNAQEVIKNIADYVTDTNNDDGVAKAIEKFVL